MQNIAEQLVDAQRRQQSVVAQVNALEQQKQLLLQEALRLDGEIRLLERMNHQGGKDESDRDKSKD